MPEELQAWFGAEVSETRLDDLLPNWILSPDDYDRWLDPAVPSGEELLVLCPDGWLEAVPASKLVNDRRNDGPHLMQPEETETLLP